MNTAVRETYLELSPPAAPRKPRKVPRTNSPKAARCPFRRSRFSPFGRQPPSLLHTLLGGVYRGRPSYDGLIFGGDY
jgi:hypothetical protein